MDKYLEYIKSLISEEYLENAKIEIRENIGDCDSIVISSPMTIYRPEINNILFARIKTKGQKPYISFKTKYKYLFSELKMLTYEVKSDNGFFRVSLEYFFNDNLFNTSESKKVLSAALNTIFLDSMNFPTFGCCSYYKKCSDLKKCIHDDQLYSTACMYRKNLESGRIFYGENKKSDTIDVNMINEKIAVFDVETPNGQNDSICSIGIVILEKNIIKDKVYYLINPETHFDIINTNIHGISEYDVANSPTFPEVWENIKNYFSGCLLVGHNVTFDLCCIKKSLKRYHIDALPVYYIDTLTISRDLIKDSVNHKLNTLCDYFNIKLTNHHNALDDSYATAELLSSLINSYNVNLDNYIKKYTFDDTQCKSVNTRRNAFSEVTKSLQELQGVLMGITSDGELNDKEIYAIKNWVDSHIDLKGNYPFDKIYISLDKVLEDNIITESERTELFTIFNNIINPVESSHICNCSIEVSNKKICLTGDFDCMPKSELSAILENQGAIIKNSVVKDLDYLIVGNKGSSHWVQGNYGTKIKKALELQSKGCSISIIKEDDLLTAIEI